LFFGGCRSENVSSSGFAGSSANTRRFRIGRVCAAEKIIRFRRFPALFFLQTGGSRYSEKGRISMKTDPETVEKGLPGESARNAEEKR
ncbi:MAG TPA: hypothetical protein PLU82_01295, partial [Oscillospiraceae bacterium]|nr:hypothetical protein [Oscillospiraceae bacterium]